MTTLVRSELLKVRTTRGWWAYLGVIALLVGVATAAEVGTADDFRRSEVDFQVTLVDAVGVGALIAIILGITIVTSEYRHGTITPTFLVTPKRELVLASKTVAAIVLSLGFAILSLAVVAAIGVPWLGAVGADLHLGARDVGVRTLQVLLLAVLWGLMGVAIGSVVHSQVAALVGTLVWIFLGELLLFGLFVLLDVEGLMGYLPFQALDAADGTAGEDLLSYWPAVGVSLAWIAVLGVAGVWRTRADDVT
jgi:ABC-type transport system involved in multi-copper enzyme maturation permease subunit